jgi:hypothetical protein
MLIACHDRPIPSQYRDLDDTNFGSSNAADLPAPTYDWTTPDLPWRAATSTITGNYPRMSRCRCSRTCWG